MTNDPDKKPEANSGKPKVECISRTGFIEIKINNKVFLRDEAKIFQEAVEEGFKKDSEKFLINFQTCQYISSEGLGCVADFWRRCQENPQYIMAALFENESANELLSFFEIIGLARVMESHIFTDKAKAEAFLAKS